MNKFYQRALELNEEIVNNRRTIHQFGGTGFDIPETVEYVKQQLASYGYEPREIGKSGVTCTVGGGGKTILLRADMDALPITEDSGEPFSCTNGTMHACGHDMHCTMLLAAAKMLKEREAELGGTVKFMFQPAEEILSGAKAMLAAGILENPQVDAAMALHVCVGPNRPLGRVRYSVGQTSHSADQFRIIVKAPKGRRGINPLSISTRIVLGFQELTPVEFPPHQLIDVKCGILQAGIAGNTVPEEARIEGVARTADPEARDRLKRRVEEIAVGIAAAFQSEVDFTWVRGVAPMVNDERLTEELAQYCAEVVGEDKVVRIPGGGGGEDFAETSARVPSMFAELCCGSEEEGYVYPNHNPKFRVNEAGLPMGAALYANCAMNWLNGQKGVTE